MLTENVAPNNTITLGVGNKLTQSHTSRFVSTRHSLSKIKNLQKLSPLKFKRKQNG